MEDSPLHIFPSKTWQW